MLHTLPLYYQLHTETRKPNAYLLPIRIFLAVGWLRAFAEKWVDLQWLNGTTIVQFFDKHLDLNAPFYFYQLLAKEVFLPNAHYLSIIIMIGQLAVGLALLVGLFTHYALLGGLFMNINFLLAGAPDPSAFYIVLQMVLLIGSAGTVFGLDGMRNKTQYWQPPLQHDRQNQFITRMSLVCAFVAALVAAVAFGEIAHFDPASSVKDPAAVLCVLACVGLGLSLIGYFRQKRQSYY